MKLLLCTVFARLAELRQGNDVGLLLDVKAEKEWTAKAEIYRLGDSPASNTTLAIKDTLDALVESWKLPACRLINLGIFEEELDPLWEVLTKRRCTGIFVDAVLQRKPRSHPRFAGISFVWKDMTPESVNFLRGDVADVIKVKIRSWDCEVVELLLPHLSVRAIILDVNTAFPPPLSFARYWLQGGDVSNHLPLHSCSLTHAVSLVLQFDFHLVQFDGKYALFVRSEEHGLHRTGVDEFASFRLHLVVRANRNDWHPIAPGWVEEWSVIDAHEAHLRAQRNATGIWRPGGSWTLYVAERNSASTQAAEDSGARKLLERGPASSTLTRGSLPLTGLEKLDPVQQSARWMKKSFVERSMEELLKSCSGHCLTQDEFDIAALLATTPCPSRQFETIFEGVTLTACSWCGAKQQMRLRSHCCSHPEDDDCWDPEFMHPSYFRVGWLRCCHPELSRMVSEPLPVWMSNTITKDFDFASSIGMTVGEPDPQTQCLLRIREGGRAVDEDCNFSWGRLGLRPYLDAVLVLANLTGNTLPDVDLPISWVDVAAPDIPVLAYSKYKNAHAIRIPPHQVMGVVWLETTPGFYSRCGFLDDWNTRKDTLLWRGTSSGPNGCCRHDHRKLVDEAAVQQYLECIRKRGCARERAVLQSLLDLKLFDVRFSPQHIFDLNDHPEEAYGLRRLQEMGVLAENNIPDIGFCGHKFLLTMDGGGYQVRNFWIPLTGSVMVQQESPIVHWLSDVFEPWQHYVPVANDLSDLVNKTVFLIANRKRARKIAREGRNLALQVVSLESSWLYFYGLIRAYAERPFR